MSQTKIKFDDEPRVKFYIFLFLFYDFLRPWYHFFSSETPNRYGTAYVDNIGKTVT